MSNCLTIKKCDNTNVYDCQLLSWLIGYYLLHHDFPKQDGLIKSQKSSAKYDLHKLNEYIEKTRLMSLRHMAKYAEDIISSIDLSDLNIDQMIPINIWENSIENNIKKRKTSGDKINKISGVVTNDDDHFFGERIKKIFEHVLVNNTDTLLFSGRFGQHTDNNPKPSNAFCIVKKGEMYYNIDVRKETEQICEYNSLDESIKPLQSQFEALNESHKTFSFAVGKLINSVVFCPFDEYIKNDNKCPEEKTKKKQDTQIDIPICKVNKWKKGDKNIDCKFLSNDNYKSCEYNENLTGEYDFYDNAPTYHNFFSKISTKHNEAYVCNLKSQKGGGKKYKHKYLKYKYKYLNLKKMNK